MSTNATQLNFGRDVQGYNAYSPLFPADIINGMLSAGVEQTFTVQSNLPTGCNRWCLIFGIESGAAIWVAKNATAVTPTSSAASGTSIVNPTQLTFLSNDVVHLITDDTTAKFSVSIYAIP